jgi:isoamylase
MAAENWADPMARSVALFIDGSTDPDVAADGTPMIDDDFLMLINSWWQPLTFTVPADLSARHWHIVCDTFDPSRTGNAGPEFKVGPRSAVVLRSPA